MAQREPGVAVLGLGLLGAGAWLIASGLGARLPGPGELWPLLLLIVGLAFIVQHAGQPDSSRGLLLLGLPLLLAGACLLAFTLQVGGLAWRDMARLWPAAPLAAGATFLALYISGGLREQPLLTLAHVFGGIGLAPLPFTTGALPGPVVDQIGRLWPLPLVALALGAGLWLRRQRRRAAGGELP